MSGIKLTGAFKIKKVDYCLVGCLHDAVDPGNRECVVIKRATLTLSQAVIIIQAHNTTPKLSRLYGCGA